MFKFLLLLAVLSVALAFQSNRMDQFVYFEMPSTHNSAITEADGFAIEKYFISALGGGLDFDQGDDLGEGNCQYLSLTDQLRMGVRHLEIDLWWDRLVDAPVVCHSPVPLFPVGEVSRQAEAANLTLEWDPKNMSCLGTKRGFVEVLTEIRDWMVLEENLQEIVVLYFDTKFYLSPLSVTKANNDILGVFGNLLWPASRGSPLQQTVQSLLSANTRVMIENAKECWAHPSEGEQLVFYPTLWTHQFSASSLQQFPNCTVEGDNDWYGQTWVRALDGTFIEAATRCGVQLVSGDYTNPDDMKLFVWSWDQQEPSSAGCTAMLPSGRWATLDCGQKLPYACLASTDSARGLDWRIDLNRLGSAGASTCPEGSVFSAPHNGYSNSVLVNAAYGQTIWVNAPNPKAL
ncbi:hypothetical protein B484DRAFT_400793 [Ochromonadaceae sp. CCMP2298]|nr:hypothetical protein B484DRAFT_400793 [Ochromonadaceae sp. CCMP2298]